MMCSEIEPWRKILKKISFMMGGRIVPGDVIVIRYEGSRDEHGKGEMHMLTSLLVCTGLWKNVAVITDGRFSGSTRVPSHWLCFS